jgi:hypothetical protein
LLLPHFSFYTYCHYPIGQHPIQLNYPIWLFYVS